MLIALIFIYIVTLGVVIYLTTVEDPFKKIEWVKDDLTSRIQLLSDMGLEHDKELMILKSRLQAYKLGYEECPDDYFGPRVYVDQYGKVSDVVFDSSLGWLFPSYRCTVPITFRKKEQPAKKQAKKKA